MGSLEKVTTREALEKWADDVRKRLGTDEAVAYVLEPKIDGSAVSLVYEDGVARPRRDARGRRARGGRDARTCARSRRSRSRCSADGAPPARVEVRGEIFFPLAGFDRFNEAQVAAGKQAAPNAAQRRGRLAAAAQPGGHGRASALDLRLRHRRARGRRARDAVGGARSGCGRAASARTRMRSALESIEEVADARIAWEARRARRSATRSTGSSIKVDSFDQQRRLGSLHGRPRFARAYKWAPTSARDAPPEDPRPRRSDGRPQSAGRARAGARRRRDGVERDAPQRGRHPAQGHPRGRPRDRPACGRRDPAGRRAGRRARAGHEAVADAEALPALQGRDRAARGRGHAPLPEPRVPVARASRRCTTGSAPRWTSRTSAGARSRSSGTRAIVRSLPDLYRLTAEQLTELDGYAEISATRAFDSIQRSKEQPFSRVLFGLNIPKVGWVIARNLALHFGSVEALADATLEDLEEVEGIGPERAELIAEWFADDENRALVEELRALGLQIAPAEASARRRGRSRAASTSSRERSRAGRARRRRRRSRRSARRSRTRSRRRRPASSSARARARRLQKAEKLGVPVLSGGRSSARCSRPRSARARSRTGPARRVRTSTARASRSGGSRRRSAAARSPASADARLVVPVFAIDAAAGRPRREPVSRAFRRRPATASEVTKASRIAGSAAPARRIADERLRGQPVEAREPGAVGDPHAGDRHAGLRERRRARRRAPAAVEPRARDGRAELLQEHLGDEVVALAVHVLDERRRAARERSNASGSASAGARPAPARPVTAIPRRSSAVASAVPRRRPSCSRP